MSDTEIFFWVVGAILAGGVGFCFFMTYIEKLEKLKDEAARSQRNLETATRDRDYWKTQYERTNGYSNVQASTLDLVLRDYMRTTTELEQAQDELAQLRPLPPDPEGKHVQQATSNRKILRTAENIPISSQESDSEPTSSSG